jgi:hypothetical protein
MPSLLISLYILLVAVIGYTALCLLFGATTRHWAEVAGLSFAAGAGIIGCLLFFKSLAGFVPSRFILIALAVVTMIALFILRSRGRLIRPSIPAHLSKNWNARRVLAAFALILIITTLASAIAQASTPGLSYIDDFAIWMLKARIVLTQPLHPIPIALLNPGLSYSHQDYPLSFPMLIAGGYAAMGAVDVQLAKLILLPIYISTLLVTYGALRGILRRAEALTITALFACAPIQREHAGMAVAEGSLVLMHTCCLILFLHWMQTGNRQELIASAAFAAFAAFTKNEGLALFPIVAVAALAFAIVSHRRNLIADTVIAFAIATVLIAPWLIYRHFLPHTHEDYGGKLTNLTLLKTNIPRLAEIIPHYLGQLADITEAGPIWLLLCLVAILGWRAFARLPVLVLWGFLLAHLSLYIATLMVTPWDLDILAPMVTAKLLMHAAPAAMLLIGLHLAEFQAPAPQPEPWTVRK